MPYVSSEDPVKSDNTGVAPVIDSAASLPSRTIPVTPSVAQTPASLPAPLPLPESRTLTPRGSISSTITIEMLESFTRTSDSTSRTAQEREQFTAYFAKVLAFYDSLILLKDSECERTLFRFCCDSVLDILDQLASYPDVETFQRCINQAKFKISHYRKLAGKIRNSLAKRHEETLELTRRIINIDSHIREAIPSTSASPDYTPSRGSTTATPSVSRTPADRPRPITSVSPAHTASRSVTTLSVTTTSLLRPPVGRMLSTTSLAPAGTSSTRRHATVNGPINTGLTARSIVRKQLFLQSTPARVSTQTSPRSSTTIGSVERTPAAVGTPRTTEIQGPQRTSCVRSRSVEIESIPIRTPIPSTSTPTDSPSPVPILGESVHASPIRSRSIEVESITVRAPIPSTSTPADSSTPVAIISREIQPSRVATPSSRVEDISAEGSILSSTLPVVDAVISEAGQLSRDTMPDSRKQSSLITPLRSSITSTVNPVEEPEENNNCILNCFRLIAGRFLK